MNRIRQVVLPPVNRFFFVAISLNFCLKLFKGCEASLFALLLDDCNYSKSTSSSTFILISYLRCSFLLFSKI